MAVDPTLIVNSALSAAATRKAAKLAPTSAPVAAAGISTGAAPVTHKRTPKMTWQDAKARRESARATVGYDRTSAIWGKTTIEVLLMVDAILDNHTKDAAVRILDSRVLLTELKKREAAEKLAFA